jgi:GH15 family glucan-1,4-alpha-glucosidase
VASILEGVDADLGELLRRSVKSILDNQNEAGAIIASPDFAEYGFCWLRDASFCAYALDLVHEHEASARYHDWVRRAVEGISPLLESVTLSRQCNEPLDDELMPPARFSMDGTMVHDDWPNFQIDGYGTWLWSLEQHLRATGCHALPDGFVPVVRTVATYVREFALASCYDVWEEHGNNRHTSTLACIFGGLSSARRLLDDDTLGDRADEVRELLLSTAREAGHFTKSNANDDVDASILWLSIPFGVVDPHDELFSVTASLIETRLELNGGIRRYPTDVYFGSGAWPVLTASLGWNFVASGEFAKARRCLQWIVDRFDDRGLLGEQFDGELRDRDNYEFWVRKWGPPAKDLMWSHAMFIVLALALAQVESSEALDGIRVDSRSDPGRRTP